MAGQDFLQLLSLPRLGHHRRYPAGTWLSREASFSAALSRSPRRSRGVRHSDRLALLPLTGGALLQQTAEGGGPQTRRNSSSTGTRGRRKRLRGGRLLAKKIEEEIRVEAPEGGICVARVAKAPRP